MSSFSPKGYFLEGVIEIVKKGCLKKTTMKTIMCYPFEFEKKPPDGKVVGSDLCDTPYLDQFH